MPSGSADNRLRRADSAITPSAARWRLRGGFICRWLHDSIVNRYNQMLSVKNLASASSLNRFAINT